MRDLVITTAIVAAIVGLAVLMLHLVICGGFGA